MCSALETQHAITEETYFDLSKISHENFATLDTYLRLAFIAFDIYFWSLQGNLPDQKNSVKVFECDIYNLILHNLI